MLTLFIVAATIWTLYWCFKLIVDWGNSRTVTDSEALCSKCADALNPAGAASAVEAASANNAPAESIEAQKAANKAAQDSVVKTPVADMHDQSNVVPLFKPSQDKDDLKTVKGIGVVMERTLNDLGITTFKQLAGFQQAEVKMVSDVLSEFNAGFGDRIQRDEWVDQAKDLVKKAS